MHKKSRAFHYVYIRPFAIIYVCEKVQSKKSYDKAMREAMTRRRYLDPIVAKQISALNLGGLCGSYATRAASGSSHTLKTASLGMERDAGDYDMRAVSASCHSLGKAIAKESDMG